MTGKRERTRRKKRYVRDGKEEFPVEVSIETVESFYVFMVCGGLGRVGLVVVRLKENMGMCVDACVTEMQFCKASAVIDSVGNEMELQGA